MPNASTLLTVINGTNTTPTNNVWVQGTNTLAAQPRHTDRAGNNLCTQQAIPETYECTHTQGVLGGGGGERVSDPCTRPVSSRALLGGKAFSERGGLGQRGCLQIRGDELGAR